MIPQNRLQIFNQGAEPGECVVYWMISARRSTWNHGLQHAIELANEIAPRNCRSTRNRSSICQ